MTQTDFYDLLDALNRDLREGRITYAEHQSELAAIVDAYERRAA